jgi:hypothetical protein
MGMVIAASANNQVHETDNADRHKGIKKVSVESLISVDRCILFCFSN